MRDFADAGFARDQHDLAVARLGARPAAQQQIDFLVTSNQPGQRGSAQCLEPARAVLANEGSLGDFAKIVEILDAKGAEARERLTADETQRSIARSYNVSQATISRLS